jgi:hypothetical protein
MASLGKPGSELASYIGKGSSDFQTVKGERTWIYKELLEARAAFSCAAN